MPASAFAATSVDTFTRNLTLNTFFNKYSHHPLTTQASNGELQPLWLWFDSLSLTSQQNLLCVTDPSWSTKLQKLYRLTGKHKPEDGFIIESYNKLSKKRVKDYSLTFITWKEIEANGGKLSSSKSHHILSLIKSSRTLLASLALWDSSSSNDSIMLKRCSCGGVKNGAFKTLIQSVIQDGYKQQKDQNNDDETAFVMYNLAAFVSIRIVQHLKNQYHRRNNNSTIPRLFSDNRLEKLIRAIPLDTRVKFIRDKEARIEKLTSSFDKNIVSAAYDDVLESLLVCNQEELLDDVLHVSRCLFTSTLNRVGSCYEAVAKSIGQDLQSLVVPSSNSTLPSNNTIPSNNTLPSANQESEKQKKKKKNYLKKKKRMLLASVILDDLVASVIHSLASMEFVSNRTTMIPIRILKKNDSSSSRRTTIVEQQLHQEIVRFASAIQDTVKRRRPMQEFIINRIRTIVSLIWPPPSSSALHVFGSVATGLNIPASDIDLMVTNNNSSSTTSISPLVNYLQNESWVRSITVISNTAIPVIKVEAKDSYCVDISFESPSHRGIETCAYIQTLVRESPMTLIPLVLVLKQYLRQHSLNDSYTGGISSYALTLMVSSVLNTFKNTGNVGFLFIKFLRTYGVDFDPRISYVSHFNGLQLRDEIIGGTESAAPAVVIIEDPLRHDQNAGKNCFMFTNAQLLFVQGLDVIQNNYFSNPDNNILDAVMFGNKQPYHQTMEEWGYSAYMLLQHYSGASSVRDACYSCGAVHGTMHSAHCVISPLLSSFPKTCNSWQM